MSTEINKAGSITRTKDSIVETSPNGFSSKTINGFQNYTGGSIINGAKGNNYNSADGYMGFIGNQGISFYTGGSVQFLTGDATARRNHVVENANLKNLDMVSARSASSLDQSTAKSGLIDDVFNIDTKQMLKKCIKQPNFKWSDKTGNVMTDAALFLSDSMKYYTAMTNASIEEAGKCITNFSNTLENLSWSDLLGDDSSDNSLMAKKVKGLKKFNEEDNSLMSEMTSLVEGGDVKKIVSFMSQNPALENVDTEENRKETEEAIEMNMKVVLSEQGDKLLEAEKLL